jgi:hypothetical protein
MHSHRIIVNLVVLLSIGFLHAQDLGNAREAATVTLSTTKGPSGGGGFSMSGAHLRLKIVDKSLVKESIEFEKKKYLTYSYEQAYIDDFDKKVHVRYNIFQDQIEFINQENIYYLTKLIGRKVHFTELNLTYKIYHLNRKYHYFNVLVEGKNSLLAKHRIRYYEAKSSESTYDKAKPARYKRLKDELYLAIDDRELIKISGLNKKEFAACFGDQSEAITSFLKENRFSHKKLEDLKKTVHYYNSL